MSARSDLIAAVLLEVAGIGRELATVGARPFGEHRLSRRQLDAMFILAHSDAAVTAGHLADALGVTPGAVTQLLGPLRDLELVESVTTEEDGRVRIIRLTATAQAQVGAFERDQVARLSSRFDGLDAAELRRLAGLLAKGRMRT
ncbi:MarR family transcriptional regulator [Microbacterium sp. KUDC0406]|uniref:MarR family winged helix-turn-helix transcriptional regulator n=1 Tax=Microbacterium sp. KUDC0406 TaxID=2909588 RepID=UPI001F42FC3F|nr:MarR family transcriptional regulator [Microbacterium sp. KUDC0406]UJP09706.1 MarR family transcriptional regulator [Microbacterium sp. KUDC0406]